MIDADEWNEMAGEAIDLGAMDALVKKSVELWADYEKLRVPAAKAKELAEAVDSAILKTLQDAGKTKYFVDGIGTVSRVMKMSVKTPKTIEEKKSLFNYLLSRSSELYYSLVSVSSQSLNAWYNQESEDAASKGNSNFVVPGLGPPVSYETLRFNKDRKNVKET